MSLRGEIKMRDLELENAIFKMKRLVALNDYYIEHTRNIKEKADAKMQNKRIIKLLDTLDEAEKRHNELIDKIIEISKRLENEIWKKK